jgi:hypothetical protein
VRELARLARVSPSTALSASAQLARDGRIHRHRGADGSWIIQTSPAWRRQLRRDLVPRRSLRDELDRLRGLPVEIWVVEPEDLTRLGVRRRVPTFVLTTRRWAGRISIPVPVVTLEHGRILQHDRERLEPVHLLVALLKLDVLAARQLYTRLTPDPKLRRTLLRWIRQEGLRSAAQQARIPLWLPRGPKPTGQSKRR